jgi:hypothetical protein
MYYLFDKQGQCLIYKINRNKIKINKKDLIKVGEEVCDI